MFNKKSHFDSLSFLTIFLLAAAFLLVPFTTSCSGTIISQMTEEQAAQALRVLTRDGKFPPESAVLDIENRFSTTRTGALARLLRARIRFESNDFGGAAQILDSDVFRQRTNLADYALWLRGRALQQTGNHAGAMNVFAELVRDFPTSLKTPEAKTLWATSALASGQSDKIPDFLKNLSDKNQADALLLTAKAFESQNNQQQAITLYRRVYFYGAGTEASKEAETKLTSLGQSVLPTTAEEIQTRAEKFYEARNFLEASNAYNILVNNFPAVATPQIHLRRLIAASNLRKTAEAHQAFNLIPQSAKEKEQAFYELALAFAKARQWSQAKQIVEEMRERFPKSDLTPKTMVAAGMAARDAKNSVEESFFLRSALASYPDAVEVAGAQFELAWLQHDAKNFALSSQMLTEHLAKYAARDTTNRGKAGYWAARDSEKAGKISEACVLYDAVMHRYSANWYGYIAEQRLKALRGQGKCRADAQFPADSMVARAAANLKTVTVAAETSTAKELERAEKSDQLSLIGLFDWSMEELQEAQKTAANSPKINLALAKHHRFKGDNVSALLALAKSYPDYAQMFPEEMGTEEWSIFYPLTNWNDIKFWAKNRNLDHFLVAGLIRQESVFNHRAKSHANAYGLMQLLIPTARATAAKYGNTTAITAESLFQPALNIELGTAYMRDQLTKYGRVEYMAVAYNAGPGRVVQWQNKLPFEIDEYVEAIPFRETRGYVQGIIRNSAQYRRLYDDNGNFRSNVGTKPLRGEIDSKPREQFAQEFPEIVLDDKTE